MGFAPTWLRQVSPLLHMTTLTTGDVGRMRSTECHSNFVCFLYQTRDNEIPLHYLYRLPSTKVVTVGNFRNLSPSRRHCGQPVTRFDVPSQCGGTVAWGAPAGVGRAWRNGRTAPVQRSETTNIIQTELMSPRQTLPLA